MGSCDSFLASFILIKGKFCLQARSQTFLWGVGGVGQIGQILGPFMITCGLSFDRVGLGHFFVGVGVGVGGRWPPWHPRSPLWLRAWSVSLRTRPLTQVILALHRHMIPFWNQDDLRIDNLSLGSGTMVQYCDWGPISSLLEVLLMR